MTKVYIQREDGFVQQINIEADSIWVQHTLESNADYENRLHECVYDTFPYVEGLLATEYDRHTARIYMMAHKNVWRVRVDQEGSQGDTNVFDLMVIIPDDAGKGDDAENYAASVCSWYLAKTACDDPKNFNLYDFGDVSFDRLDAEKLEIGEFLYD